MRTLVLAIGNPLRGDDGIGVAILTALRQLTVPLETTLLEGGTCGLEMVLLWQKYDRLVIIDAVEMGAAAGEWRCFTPDEVVLETEDCQLRGTLHDAGLAEALLLGAALRLLPPTIIIFGVQPQEIGWTSELSPVVAQAIPFVSHAIAAALNS